MIQETEKLIPNFGVKYFRFNYKNALEILFRLGYAENKKITKNKYVNRHLKSDI